MDIKDPIPPQSTNANDVAAPALPTLLQRYPQLFVRIGTLGTIVLTILRRPVWTYYHPDWDDISLYPSWGIAVMPNILACIVDVMLLCINLVALNTILNTESLRSVLPEWRLKVLLYAAKPLVWIKLVNDVVLAIIGIWTGKAYWSLSPLEAVILILCEPCFGSKLYQTMYRSLSYFCGLMFLFGCVIVSWTILEMAVLGGIGLQNASISVMNDNIWNMLMILNTANWPPPVIPFYERGSLNFAFFIAYSVVVDWGFLNLVLGLIVAFFEDSFTSDDDKVDELMNGVAANPSANEVSMLEDDKNGIKLVVGGSTVEANGQVVNPLQSSLVTTATVSDVATLENDHTNAGNDDVDQQANRKGVVENMQIEANTSTMESNEAAGEQGGVTLAWLNPYVESHSFNLVVDLTFCVLGFNFIFGSSPNSILTVQIVLNSAESLVRVFVRKETFWNWLHTPRNLSNVIFTTVLVINTLVYFSMCAKTARIDDCSSNALNKRIKWTMNGIIVFAIIAIRACILVRISLVLRNFTYDYIPETWQLQLMRAKKIVAETFSAFSHLVIMLLTLMYLFSAMGMHFFGGYLSKNPDLPTYSDLIMSDYAVSGYWPINFNDMPSAFVAMFTLLYINNMQIITSGCVAVTSRWGEIFFGLFYIVGVLYVRNIFTSFLWSRIGKILDPGADPIENFIDEEISVDYPRMPFSNDTTPGNDDDRNSVASAVIDGPNQRPSMRHKNSYKDRSSVARDRSEVRTSMAETCSDSVKERRSSIVNRDSLALNRQSMSRRTLVEVMMHGVDGLSMPGDAENKQVAAVKEGMKTIIAQTAIAPAETQPKNAIFLHEYMAVIVMNAKYGHILEPFKERISLRAFKMRSKMYQYVLIACWLLTILRLFQAPPWIDGVPEKDLKNYIFSNTPYVSNRVNAIMKIPLLLLLASMLILEVISQKDMVKTGAMHYFRWLMVLTCLTAVICLLIAANGNRTAAKIEWFISFSSIVFTFWFDRNAMKRLIVVMGVLPKLLVLVFIFGVFVGVAAVYGNIMFNPKNLDHGDDDYNADYYSTYIQSCWTTFVAITSSSYPQQFMPAMRTYREFSIYFMGVISIGGFFILESAIAVVNTAYQNGVTVTNRIERKVKANALSYIFNTMATVNMGKKKKNDRRCTVEIVEEPCVSAKQLDSLLCELYTHYGEYRSVGNSSVSARAIIRTLLDIDGDCKINKRDFSYFYSVARVRVKKVPENFLTLKERQACKDERKEMRLILARTKTGWKKAFVAGKALREKLSVEFKACINSSFLGTVSKKYWSLLSDSVSGLLGSACVLLKSYPDAHKTTANFLLAFLLVEFLCKWFLLGINSYLRNTRNRIDFFIVMSLLLIMLIGLLSHKAEFFSPNRTTSVTIFDFVCILRLFLYPRNVAIFSSPVNGVAWKNVLPTVIQLSFAFAEAFICLGFTFAQAGVLFYGGLIPKAGINRHLDNSPFGENNFYILNFNDITSSFFTLFSCLRVSDWDVIAQGVVTSSGHVYNRGFFGMWYFLGVVLMLNILKSYFVIVFRSRTRKGPEGQESSYDHDSRPDSEDEAESDSENEDGNMNGGAEEGGTPLKEAARATLSAEDTAVDEEEEMRLEKMNSQGLFVVDVAELVQRIYFIPVDGDGDAIVKQVREEGIRAKSIRVSSRVGLGNASLASQDSVDADTDTVARRAILRNGHRYVVQLPYKQGMNPKLRIPILKRIEAISMDHGVVGK